MSDTLVTVAVTTYNAGAFVVETLNSVYDQTYSPIELIVSDDGSADDTVEQVRKWLDEYGSKFSRTQLLVVEKNTGVSANCNRCINASSSDWIKFIAGDDILLPTCIEDNMRFVGENPGVRILFSQVKMFIEEFSEIGFRYTYPVAVPMNLMNPAFTASDQYRILLQSDCINYTPSYFFHKPTVLSVGGYDETNRMVEDYPMWLKLTRACIRLHYMNKETVGYRRHGLATNNKTGQPLIQPSVFRCYSFRREHVFPELPWTTVMNERFTMVVAKWFENSGMNKRTFINEVLFKLLSVYMNPFRYIVFARRILRLV